MKFPAGTRVRRKDDAPGSRGECGTVVGVVWVKWDHEKNDGASAFVDDIELILPKKEEDA